MANQLAKETSLYLRQHAENPVDWMPWGKEAFAKASAEDKPMLVSIGYSSCHWCHVMAHESFEDDYIARIMNKHFVCVKVDREERPDVDRVYMEAVQMINQHGGWPLNAFCLPDGRPFYGGTYFPPQDRGQGMIPWPQLLMRISDYFQSRREELEENAGNIVANLKHQSTVTTEEASNWEVRDLLGAVRKIIGTADLEEGGFGEAPKFPPSMVLQFLLAMRQTRACGNENPKMADRIDKVVSLTLEKMARGGLFDQIGGGFCRYCVDDDWTIPHFEKMLYDNALLIETFSMGWSRYRNPLFERVVADTVEWLEREMRTTSGLFAASIDADSPEGEGRFYCWTPEQLRVYLDEETAERFSKAYRITKAGNFEDGLSYPQFDGTVEDRDELLEARSILYEKRLERPAPVCDKKVLVFWNALMARALIHAGSIFNRKEWVSRGGEVLSILLQEAFQGEHLLARIDEDAPEAFLDDYATLAHACLVASGREDLLPTQDTKRFREAAVALGSTVLSRFQNEGGSGFYFTGVDADTPVLRQIEWYDNATPSGNSTMVHVLVGLSTLVEDVKWQRALDSFRPSYASLVDRVANGVAFGLTAWTQEASGLLVLKASTTKALQEFSNEVSKRIWRPYWTIIDPDVPKGHWRLCVGTTCLPDFKSSKEAAETATLSVPLEE
ncbi:MAG: thioredoxin domain-containing protein [Verrucomicrobiota bacterium]